MKTLLILVDGMRPDAIEHLAEAQEILRMSEYTLSARTVLPSQTLPCHISLFHSVEPGRHGTVTNTYAPQVRPVDGLCEVLAKAGKSSALIYNWGPLRDVARPRTVAYSICYNGDRLGYVRTNEMVTQAAVSFLPQSDADFTFFYLGLTDYAGHSYGWMAEQYFDSLRSSFNSIKRVLEVLPDDYNVIITADHGGHDRCHGTEMPEDMTIPIIVMRKGMDRPVDLSDASIMDIAPTIATLLGVEPDEEWEGKSLVK